MQLKIEAAPDVPDLVAALATQFLMRGYNSEDACVIVLEMLADAMSEDTRMH